MYRKRLLTFSHFVKHLVLWSLRLHLHAWTGFVVGRDRDANELRDEDWASEARWKLRNIHGNNVVLHPSCSVVLLVSVDGDLHGRLAGPRDESLQHDVAVGLEFGLGWQI